MKILVMIEFTAAMHPRRKYLNLHYTTYTFFFNLPCKHNSDTVLILSGCFPGLP